MKSVRVVVLVVLAVAVMVVSPALPASAASTDTLDPGQQLGSGQSLQTGSVALTMTAGGDLQLRVGTAVTWSTGTAGQPGATLNMQTDGNLVLRAASGSALWASWTQGHAGARATLLSTGVLAVVSAEGATIWWSGILTPPRTLPSGGTLTAPAGHITLTLQTDGNLVMRRDGAAIWASWTQGHPGSFLTMQGDGNLVLRSSSGVALWATWTRGTTGGSLWVQDNGLLVVYSDAGYPLWYQDRTLGSTLCALTPRDPSGTSITRWNPVVLCVLAMLGQPAGELSDVDTIIVYESSGDPNAINLYDINAQEGHPSIGLVQVIKPTFDAWKSALLPNDLYNPAANVYAGMNYAIHRYGSIHNIPGLVSLRNGGRYKGYIVAG